MKHKFIGESLSVTMLSGLSIPISRMPLLEKSLITQIPLLVMDCDKPVGLLKKSTNSKHIFLPRFIFCSPCVKTVFGVSGKSLQSQIESILTLHTLFQSKKINTLYYYKIKL